MDNFAPEFVALYEVGPFLGKGAFSEVYEVKDRVTGAKYAVKIIKKELIQRTDQLRRMETEVKILKTMRHSNIIPLHHMIETPTYLYLIMELVKGGELFDKIVQKGNYSEREASSLIKKVVSAIEFLHQNNIAHRDLKPENLLVKEGDDTHVMISDFGLSRILGEDSRAFTACGTPYYVAPEVLSGSGYGKDVDLWSIGVITYFLLGGFPPFMGTTLKEIVEQILTHNYDFPSPYFDSISEVGKDFIRKLLVGPDKRMSAQQALLHPWIQSPEKIPVVPISIQRRPLTKISDKN